MTSAAQLDLNGGQLDILVVAGRLAAFIVPTPSDLSAYTWTGQIRSVETAGTLIGVFDFTLTAEQASVSIAAVVTTLLPPRANYEITVAAPDSDPVTLLIGTITRRAGVVA